MPFTTDQLTRKYYADLGYHVAKVESWKVHPELRRADFLGIYDYLAFNDEETIAVQTTSKTNRSSHWHKMLKASSFSRWTQLKAKRRSELITWEKVRGRWVPTIEKLVMEDWQKYQAKISEQNNKIDTESPLYKMLFPDGTAVPNTAAQAQPTM